MLFCDLANFFVCEVDHPRRVVERLPDDVARGFASLELDHNDIGVTVKRQKVDPTTGCGLDLAADDQEIVGKDRGILLDPALDALFLVEHRRGTPHELVSATDAPELDLIGHGLPPSSGRSQPSERICTTSAPTARIRRAREHRGFGDQLLTNRAGWIAWAIRVIHRPGGPENEPAIPRRCIRSGRILSFGNRNVATLSTSSDVT